MQNIHSILDKRRKLQYYNNLADTEQSLHQVQNKLPTLRNASAFISKTVSQFFVKSNHENIHC